VWVCVEAKAAPQARSRTTENRGVVSSILTLATTSDSSLLASSRLNSGVCATSTPFCTLRCPLSGSHRGLPSTRVGWSPGGLGIAVTLYGALVLPIADPQGTLRVIGPALLILAILCGLCCTALAFVALLAYRERLWFVWLGLVPIVVVFVYGLLT